MREILLMSIFVAVSLAMQIFFLRLSKDYFEIETDDPRWKKMLNLTYLNIGVYIFLIGLLFIQVLRL